jgi:thioesterase domain-containing protein/acyl carrier protein
VNGSGKLDRPALPAPERGGAGREPAGPAETALAAIFADVLGLERVGADAGFFELGGDSILALRLVTRARQEGIEISPRDVFSYQTVEALVAATATPVAERASTGFEPLLPIQPRGDRDPLFFFPPGVGLAWAYFVFPPLMGADQPIYGLQVPGYREGEAMAASVDELAGVYVDLMRSVRPHGPYHLAGWSLGGEIAFAVASRLQAAGEKVGLLALIDSYHGQDLAMPEEEVLPDLLMGLGLGPDLFRDERPASPEEAARRVLALLAERGDGLGTLDERTAIAAYEVYRNARALAMGYRPGHLRGDMVFFTAARGRSESSPTAQDVWGPHLDGRIEEYVIDAPHHRLMSPEPASEIAGVLIGALEKHRATESRESADGHQPL